MAQVVGYFEDFATEERRNEAYSEGPFVLVNASGWRIEAEITGSKCPVMIEPSIFGIKEQLGWGYGKMVNREEAERICDALNAMTKTGQIVRDDRGFWRDVNAA